MATRTVERVVTTCDRCGFGKEKPATQERKWALEDRYYHLDLCDEHADAFDRDQSRWTLLAAEIDNPYNDNGRAPASKFFTEERKLEARRINELTDRVRREAAGKAFAERRAAEIDAEEIRERELRALNNIPGAKIWRLTHHARQRMAERHVDIEDVLAAAAMPEHTYRQPWRGPQIAVHQAGQARVVVNDVSHAIITVIDRYAPLETAESFRDSVASAAQTTKERTAL